MDLDSKRVYKHTTCTCVVLSTPRPLDSLTPWPLDPSTPRRTRAQNQIVSQVRTCVRIRPQLECTLHLLWLLAKQNYFSFNNLFYIILFQNETFVLLSCWSVTLSAACILIGGRIRMQVPIWDTIWFWACVRRGSWVVGRGGQGSRVEGGLRGF